MFFDNKFKTAFATATLGIALSGCDKVMTPGELMQPLMQTVGNDVTLKGYIKILSDSEDFTSPADSTRGLWRKVLVSDSPNFDVPTVEAYIPELRHPSLGSLLANVEDGQYVELNGAVRRLGEGQVIFFETVDIQRSSQQ